MRQTYSNSFRLLAISLLAFQSASADSTSLSSTDSPAVAWSAGVIRINGADHSGSGNVLPGAKLETMRSAGQLYLSNGTRMKLAASTRVSVDAQSVNLEGGAARIDSMPATSRPLHIAAGELHVTAAGGTIQRLRQNELIVTAASKPSEVRKSNGVLVAMVRPGETLAFSVPAGRANSIDTRMTGRVSNENGRFYLTDEVSSLKTELQGGRPASYSGQRVQALGELIQNNNDNRRTLVVKEYAMLQDPPTPQTGSTGGGSGSAAPAGTGSGTGAGTGAGAGAGAGAGSSMSTTMIVGITVATVGGIAGSVALVAGEEKPGISQ